MSNSGSSARCNVRLDEKRPQIRKLGFNDRRGPGWTSRTRANPNRTRASSSNVAIKPGRFASPPFPVRPRRPLGDDRYEMIRGQDASSAVKRREGGRLASQPCRPCRGPLIRPSTPIWTAVRIAVPRHQEMASIAMWRSTGRLKRRRRRSWSPTIGRASGNRSTPSPVRSGQRARTPGRATSSHRRSSAGSA